MTTPSWAKNGGTTLSQASPALVVSRQTLDRFQVRICCGAATIVTPRAAQDAVAQARSA